jgi:RNA polymerase subunit RPABC4/transcription elongation factor Spt4
VSQEERRCRNCGAVMTPDERTCPDCGRLSIDHTSSRLGGGYPTSAAPKTFDLGKKSKSADHSDSTPSASDNESESPGSDPKPSSFYAVAPEVAQECPQCGAAYVRQGTCRACGYKMPKQKTTGCGPCMIFIILISWVLTFAYML